MSDETKLQELGSLMSDVSEECWCAGWLMGTEDTLPGLCWLAKRTGAPVPWGMGLITVEVAQRMIALAKEAGSWADLNHDWSSPRGFVPHTPDWDYVCEYCGDQCRPLGGEA